MTRPSEAGGGEERIGNQEVGRFGERLARVWLTRRGWRVLWRNFRAKGGGEVDLVCRDHDTLVFVEVKTRSSVDFGRPGAAVTPDKQRLITRGAVAWLRGLHQTNILFRFDIVEVIVEDGKPPELKLIQNAFQLPDDYFV